MKTIAQPREKRPPPELLRPTPEELALELVLELKRTGRYQRTGGVLILTPDAIASISCIVRIGSEAARK